MSKLPTIISRTRVPPGNVHVQRDRITGGYTVVYDGGGVGGLEESSGGSGGGGNDDAYVPPRGSGSSSGVDVGNSAPDSIAFIPDPSGQGTVVTANPNTVTAPPVRTDLNLGWNSGAHSVESLAADWTGRISFDIPDVLNARPGGVAIGLAPVSELPTQGRNGFGYLHYGLVFTAETVRVIQGGAVVLSVSYASVRANRGVDTTTDTVNALMYGQGIRWMINGVTLFAGAFGMPEAYALDATLYTAYDTVDNPAFTEGEWDVGIEDQSLVGLLPTFTMTADATLDESITGALGGFNGRFSEEDVWELIGSMPGFTFECGVDDGIAGTIGPFSLRMAETADFDSIEGRFGPFTAWIGMSSPGDDTVPFSALIGDMPRFTMVAEAQGYDLLQTVMPAFTLRMGDDPTSMEIVADMPGFRFVSYGGEMTPLLEVTEWVGVHAPIYPITYISVAVIERIDGSTSAVVYATTTVDGTEQLSVQDQGSALQTFLMDAVEQIAAGDRIRVLTLRADGSGEVGSETWVVNTESSASTRYDGYGFNSFAAIGDRHYGCRADGVYLLEGGDDAGHPISAGVSLGQHDFGTQALKSMDAVYVGVSSSGALFLKVGDGENEYTYKARRNDERMKTQRFDTGRGLRSNFFTFELTNEGDAFELDSVTFHVVASQRRI